MMILILPSTPQQGQRVSASLADIHGGENSFEDILAELVALPVSGEVGKGSTTAEQPGIGESATAFNERAMIQPTAIQAELAKQDRTGFANTIERLAAEIAVLYGEALAERKGLDPPFQNAIRPQQILPSAAPASHLAAPLAQGVPQTSTSANAGGQASMSRPIATGGPAALIEPAIRTSTRPASSASAPLSVRPGATASGTAPVHLALVAAEHGLRLVLRLPSLSPAEQNELADKLAEAFARRGQRAPEVQLHQTRHTN